MFNIVYIIYGNKNKNLSEINDIGNRIIISILYCYVFYYKNLRKQESKLY